MAMDGSEQAPGKSAGWELIGILRSRHYLKTTDGSEPALENSARRGFPSGSGCSPGRDCRSGSLAQEPSETAKARLAIDPH